MKKIKIYTNLLDKILKKILKNNRRFFTDQK